MISYIIDVRTSIALCVMISIISHLFTSETKEMEMDFSSSEKICYKVLFLVAARACIYNPW